MPLYYQDESVTIYHADCRDIVKPSMCDLVVTSPQYNKGRQSGAFANMRDGYLSHSDDMEDSEYTLLQREILSALWVAVGSAGAIFYNHKPQIHDGAVRLPTHYLPPEVVLRQVIIWDRRVGMNWNARFFCPQHEWVLLLAHPDFILTSRSASAIGDVWDLAIDQTREDGHPCAFPLSLPKRAIGATNAEIVLDPFMGSGTTLRAAKDLGRKAIGIEIEERYCEIAARRMAQEVLAL
jgi:site-specific DNA-methyltransferase (adenine-specific)